MSDLVREARRNAKNWADKPDSAAMWNRFADHIEQLEADNECLIRSDKVWLEANQQKDRQIEGLEAVVDAARHLLAGGDVEAVYHLEKALAALENRDE